jgi:ABC-type lipoprotein export system ATPase subunit
MLVRKDIRKIQGSHMKLEALDGSKVLDGTSFYFEEGDVYRIDGKQGNCSEFLKLLSVLNTKWSGNYYFNDDNLNEMSFEEFQSYRLNIAYTFDHGGLLNNKSILDNILLPLQYHNELSSEEALKISLEYLERFELLEFKDLRPAMTPGYVRKLACVIRSLTQRPQVLVMDGPTTAIDREKSQLLIDIINEKRKSGEIKILLFSTTYETGFETWEPKTLLLSQSGIELVNSKDQAV